MERIAAIAGIHEYPLRVAPGVSSMQIKAESMKQALDDAGLNWGDVDGLYDALDGDGGGGLGLAAYLGINPADDRHHSGRRLVLRVPRRARAARHRGGALQRGRHDLRLDLRVNARADRHRRHGRRRRPPGSRTWKRPTAQP